MTQAAALCADLASRGVLIEAKADGLRVDAPKGTITTEILASLREHKREILKLLSSWPPECLDSERRFGTREARLYPLLGKRVMTPEGPGVLWRVFTGSIGLVLDSHPKKVTYFTSPKGISPLAEHEN